LVVVRAQAEAYATGADQEIGVPGAAGEFEGFGDGEKKFFGEGAADELDADGETAGGR